MGTYLFISTTTPNVRAFTSDPEGTNLPTDYAPWEAVGPAIPARRSTASIAQAIQRDGFFLVSSIRKGSSNLRKAKA
jgi:hypothetical protein